MSEYTFLDELYLYAPIECRTPLNTQPIGSGEPKTSMFAFCTSLNTNPCPDLVYPSCKSSLKSPCQPLKPHMHHSAYFIPSCLCANHPQLRLKSSDKTCFSQATQFSSAHRSIRKRSFGRRHGCVWTYVIRCIFFKMCGCVWEPCICIMANRLEACQGRWLKSSVRNSSNDLVFQGVKGLSNSISDNICLCVLEPDSLYWCGNSSLSRSLAEAQGRAVDVFRPLFVQGVWVRRPFGQRRGLLKEQKETNLRCWSGKCLILFFTLSLLLFFVVL